MCQMYLLVSHPVSSLTAQLKFEAESVNGESGRKRARTALLSQLVGLLGLLKNGASSILI